MNAIRRTWTTAALALSAAAISTGARADQVVPNANASTAGDTDNRFPLLTSGGMRYQQVFDSSQFSSFGGPQLINEIDLRNGIFLHEAFTATIADIQISLSTTSKAPDGLSTTFASNVGADATQVYSGSLTISSTDAAGPGNTHVFDIAIHFQNPFLYDPSTGNLLLDIANLSGAGSAIGSDFFDAVHGTGTGDAVSRVAGAEGSPGATTGTADSLGLIVQFQTAPVPEPSSLALCGLGALALAGYARRRRARA